MSCIVWDPPESLGVSQERQKRPKSDIRLWRTAVCSRLCRCGRESCGTVWKAMESSEEQWHHQRVGTVTRGSALSPEGRHCHQRVGTDVRGSAWMSEGRQRRQRADSDVRGPTATSEGRQRRQRADSVVRGPTATSEGRQYDQEMNIKVRYRNLYRRAL